jgi:hypothetical protein
MSVATSAVDRLPPYSAKDGSAPPSYFEAVKQAIIVLEEKMKEDPQGVADKLSESLGGNDADKAFIQDMQSLTETVSRLDKLFEDVYVNLVTFDADKQPDESGQVTEFAPLWWEIKRASKSTLHIFSLRFPSQAEARSLFLITSRRLIGVYICLFCMLSFLSSFS